MSENPAGFAMAIAMILAGLVAAAQLWRCWTGRSRRWVRRQTEVLLVLSWGPFGALLLLGTGVFTALGEPVGSAVGGLLCLAGFGLLVPGMIYFFFQPRWWGPRWFRQLAPEQRLPDVGDPHTAVGVALSTKPGFASEAIAADAAGQFGQRLDSWKATFIYDPATDQRAHALAVPGGIGGTLTLYRGGLTFAGNHWEDKLRLEPTALAVPIADLQSIRVAAADAGGAAIGGAGRRARARRLIVTTPAGEMIFEVKSASRVVDRVAEIAGRKVW